MGVTTDDLIRRVVFVFCTMMHLQNLYVSKHTHSTSQTFKHTSLTSH